MKHGVSLICLICCISSGAEAQRASISNFNPIPTTANLSPELRAEILDDLRKVVAANEMVAPSQIELGATTIWQKATKDGFIACAVIPPQNGSQTSHVAAISISDGPFGGAVLRNIWDNATYSQYGCGTPGGIKLL